jgi:prephenate dehydratase
MKVAFQGEPGAFSEEMSLAYFDHPSTVPCESFEAVFETVASKQVEFGVIPIENSLAGSIHQNYDLLLRHQLHIVGEYFLRVRLCLIGFPGATKGSIRHIFSHPQPLGQSAGYLRKMRGVTTEAVYDTAGSVKILKATGEPSAAAIASRRAAEIYGMEILEANIEDNPENYTRFLVIAPEAVIPTGDAKSSIVFILKNQPGALFKALSVFALRDIDLTKIESRPLAGKPWEYLFYIDFLGALQEERAKRALDHLGEYALMLRVLGSYPRANVG